MKTLRFTSISILLVFALLGVKAQSVTRNLFVVDVISPGISYEFGVNRYTSIKFGLHYGLDFGAFGIDHFTTNHVLFRGVAQGEYRVYLNMGKRQQLGKNTAFNSANFLAGVVQGRFPTNVNFRDEYAQPGYLFGAAYGIQRNMKKRVNLNLLFGLGYGDSGLNSPEIQLILQTSIGIRITKKSKPI